MAGCWHTSMGRLAGVAAMLAAALVLPARGQNLVDRQSILPDGLGLEHGALLFHGNYCGPGNRAPLPPIDALDRACMRHDACSPDADSGRLPECVCNARLHAEAHRIARDPRQPDDLRALAETVAVGVTLLPCDDGRRRAF